MGARLGAGERAARRTNKRKPRPTCSPSRRALCTSRWSPGSAGVGSGGDSGSRRTALAQQWHKRSKTNYQLSRLRSALPLPAIGRSHTRAPPRTTNCWPIQIRLRIAANRVSISDCLHVNLLVFLGQIPTSQHLEPDRTRSHQNQQQQKNNKSTCFNSQP